MHIDLVFRNSGCAVVGPECLLVLVFEVIHIYWQKWDSEIFQCFRAPVDSATWKCNAERSGKGLGHGKELSRKELFPVGAGRNAIKVPVSVFLLMEAAHLSKV